MEPRVWNKRDPNCPPGAIYVGRPTKWGNPWSHRPSRFEEVILVPTREDAVSLFINDVMIRRPHMIEAAQRELRGKHLVCWCAPEPCHADFWLEVANW